MGKIVTITYMKEGSPKSWDKKLRTYEITYPEGKKVLWKKFFQHKGIMIFIPNLG